MIKYCRKKPVPMTVVEDVDEEMKESRTKTLDRMDADKHTAIRDDSVRFFKQIGIETPLMEAERR